MSAAPSGPVTPKYAAMQAAQIPQQVTKPPAKNGDTVNPYYIYSSPPAPTGIADYGLVETANGSDTFTAYSVNFTSAAGAAQIYAISAYNPSPPSGVHRSGASLQFNLVFRVATASGATYDYWLQDVAGFITDSNTLSFWDNVWNYTTPTANMSAKYISGAGGVYEYSHATFYASPFVGVQQYSLPLSIVFNVTTAYFGGAAHVSFAYSVDGSTPIIYDNVTITEPSPVISAYMTVDGNTLTSGNYGHYYDAELVFGGEYNGESTTFSAMNALLAMGYGLPSGALVFPRSLFEFGSNTAESAYNLATSYLGGYLFEVSTGSLSFTTDYLPSVAPLAASIQSVEAPQRDAGQPQPVALTGTISGGTGPYTYTVYVDGQATGITGTISGPGGFSITITLPPLGAGLHNFYLVFQDQSGQTVQSNTYSINVNSDPTVSLSANVSATDLGLPVGFSWSGQGGTPPYTYTCYLNDAEVSCSSPLSLRLGSNSFYVVLTDSAGYQVQSNVVTVQVNPDPTVSLSANVSVTDVGLPIGFTNTTSGGTPPYTYTWYVNGSSVGSTFPKFGVGAYFIVLGVKDSAGYVVDSHPVVVHVNPDPSLSTFSVQPENGLLYLDTGFSGTASASGGTPPYTYEWLVNGVEVASGPTATYTFTSPTSTVTLRVVDSAGYIIESQSITFSRSVNYTFVGAVAAVTLIVVALVVYVELRRRATRGVSGA